MDMEMDSQAGSERIDVLQMDLNETKSLVFLAN